MKIRTITLLVSVFSGVSCGVETSQNNAEKINENLNLLASSVEINTPFFISGETLADEGGQGFFALNAKRIKLNTQTAVHWATTVTESDCELSSQDIFVGLKTGPDEYTQFPETLEAGEHEVGFMISSEKVCRYTILAELKENKASAEGDKAATKTTEVDPKKEELEEFRLGESKAFDWVLQEKSPGIFSFHQDFQLVLEKSTFLSNTYGLSSLNCDFEEYNSPKWSLKTEGQWEELPYWKAMDAGTYEIRIEITGTKDCKISGSFGIAE
jgi:hypothetical protein